MSADPTGSWLSVSRTSRPLHRDRRTNLEICETFNQREEGGDKLLVRGAVLHSGSVEKKKPWQEWPSVMARLEAQIVFC